MTKEEILDKCYKSEIKDEPLYYESEASKAMQLYADQQTAEKDEELNGYKLQYNEAVEHINELYKQIKEMKEYISELNIQISYGK